MNPPLPSPEEIFRRLLDESSALLGAPQDAGIAFPDDDLHREILLPLLPAMLGDDAIRKHWHDQAATGFLARLARHLHGEDAAPRWQPGDFEIHVTASFSAGADAKALADTLLSEDSMRDMSAALMNQILDAVWPKLAIVSVAGPEGVSVPVVGVVTATEEITTVPVVEVAEEVAPVPEQFIEEPPLEIAAVWKPTPFFTRLPPQAAMIAQRLTRRMIRRSRENPISGSRTSHGGLGARDWSAGNPIAGCAAQP